MDPRKKTKTANRTRNLTRFVNYSWPTGLQRQFISSVPRSAQAAPETMIEPRQNAVEGAELGHELRQDAPVAVFGNTSLEGHTSTAILPVVSRPSRKSSTNPIISPVVFAPAAQSKIQPLNFSQPINWAMNLPWDIIPQNNDHTVPGVASSLYDHEQASRLIQCPRGTSCRFDQLGCPLVLMSRAPLLPCVPRFPSDFHESMLAGNSTGRYHIEQASGSETLIDTASEEASISSSGAKSTFAIIEALNEKTKQKLAEWGSKDLPGLSLDQYVPNLDLDRVTMEYYRVFQSSPVHVKTKSNKHIVENMRELDNEFPKLPALRRWEGLLSDDPMSIGKIRQACQEDIQGGKGRRTQEWINMLP